MVNDAMEKNDLKLEEKVGTWDCLVTKRAMNAVI